MESIGRLRERLKKKTEEVELWEDSHRVGLVKTVFDAEVKAVLGIFGPDHGVESRRDFYGQSTQGR